MEFTILFADIFDFTKFSEKSAPNEAFKWLNQCYVEVGPIIRKYGGFIDKYIGDGLMALFPAESDTNGRSNY